MDVRLFLDTFENYFPGAEKLRITAYLEDTFLRSALDKCFDVKGMTSLKKSKVLNIAFAILPEDESYFELGTYQGKSLISAMMGNKKKAVYGCDNFSEFRTSNSLELLEINLCKYGVRDQVEILDGDFRDILGSIQLPRPIGVYFNDGPHDEGSQYSAVKLIERHLADQALMIVDDWRLGPDSQSYAKQGTERAIAESKHRWILHHELPARFNGDQASWWNGLAIYSFMK